MKDKIGQANHFIITILIGLNEILVHDTEKPEGFRTSWNPSNKKASVDRSREYALNASLAWAVDALDCYLIECTNTPSIINEATSTNLKSQSISKSIANKIDYLFEATKQTITDLDFKIYTAMARLGVVWRNKTIHSMASNSLAPQYRSILTSNSTRIQSLFCGLDVFAMLDSYDKDKSPTMKEVTAFIRAIHKYVERLDSYFISNELDMDNYATVKLDSFFERNKKSRNSFPTFNKERQEKKLKAQLLSNGFSTVEDTFRGNTLSCDFYSNYTEHFKQKFINETEES